MEKYDFGKYITILSIISFIILYPILNGLLGYFGEYTLCYSLYMLFIFIMSIKVISATEVRFNNIDVIFILFSVWQITRVFISEVPTDFSVQITYILFLLVYICMRNTYTEEILPYTCFGGGIIQASWGILQQYDIIPGYNYFFKSTGTFDNPALWGIYLAIALLSAIHLAQKSKKTKYIYILSIPLILYSLYISQSRAAWLSLIFGIITFIRLSKRRCTAIYMCLIILCLILYIMRPTSADGRLYIYIVSLGIFSSSPLIGRGISSFQALYMPEQAKWLSEHSESRFFLIADDTYYAFNEFIRIGCETGIIGLLLFLILILLCLKITGNNKQEKPFAVRILIAILVFSMFSYPFNETFYLILFCIIIACISNEERNTLYHFKCHKSITILCIIMLGIHSVSSTREYRVYHNANHHISERYPLLKSSPLYTGYYGEKLFHEEKYKDAIPVLEQACLLRPNSKLICILGICYQKEKIYNRAEEKYIQAANMVPTRILPSYHLFNLYKEIGNDYKAKEYANKILSMRVKVVNSTVIRIRGEMRKYLKNEIKRKVQSL